LRKRFHPSKRPSMSKTILITGASNGFGRDTAETLFRAG
jgi:NADP-dependent 3-hydroxy acid dehydrogenase YdfG